jgi:catechol-2,3-dioxygenase
VKGIIGHIILNVKDFDESELFYDKLLTQIGFMIDHIDEGDFGKVKSYRQGEHNLWIRFDRQKESEKFVRNVGLDHIAFELKSKPDVDKIYELIKKLNVKITREPKKYPEYTETYYAFYFRDPNGIPLEVYMQ